MREEQTDLSFLEFGGTRRPYTAPDDRNTRAETRNTLNSFVGRGGLEPPTLGLKARCSAN